MFACASSFFVRNKDQNKVSCNKFLDDDVAFERNYSKYLLYKKLKAKHFCFVTN